MRSVSISIRTGVARARRGHGVQHVATAAAAAAAIWQLACQARSEAVPALPHRVQIALISGLLLAPSLEN
jgi:hypothetical protein